LPGNSPNPRAGDIWDVILDKGRGREQSGYRPALVVSNDRFNDVPNELVVIAPLTRTDRGVPLHVAIAAPEGGLMADSVVMTDQVRAVSLERFRQRRGDVRPETLVVVQRMIGEIIDR
jgi:mRNA interferase MazF